MKHSLLRKRVRTFSLMFVILICSLGSFQGVVWADCPQGVSEIDCQAITNDWTSWVPNSCSQSVPDTSILDGYTLPADTGKTGMEATIGSDGKVNDPKSPDYGKSVTFPQFAKLGQAYQDYYITMRWKYASWNWDGTSTMVDQSQFNWFSSGGRPKLVLVSNPHTGKSIITAVLESGPAPWAGVDSQPNNIPKEGWVNPETGTPLAYTGRVSGMPKPALDALGAQTDVPPDLTYSWAPDQNATPGPTTISNAGSGTPSCTPGVGPGGVVFLSQRDPRWYGQIICWASGGCDTVYNEGCWATSTAMIISTFTHSLVTPMQTEGSGKPPKSFSNSGLLDYAYYTVNSANFNKALSAVKQGALVLLHGSGRGPDGGPYYNTPTHYEVLRGVSSDNQNILVNDPWDLPDPTNNAQPAPGGHSLRQWPVRDVLPYTLDFDIIVPKGTTLNL